MKLPRIRRADQPVHRVILSEAFRATWEHRRYWPLAFFASFLLTAGSYDVLFTAVNTVVSQATAHRLPPSAYSLSSLISLQTSTNGIHGTLAWISGVQAILVVAILFLTLAVCSVISQGALVYALGAVKRGKRPTLAEALRVGGGAFWPVAVLNALVLSTLWFLRFLISAPLSLALERTTPGAWMLYFFSFLIFTALAFLVTLVHLFALNALILQGAPIAHALLRGIELIKRHWVIAIETALLLFVLAIAVASAAVVAFFFATLPLLAALVAALATGSPLFFAAVLGVGLALFVLAGLSLSAFLTQAQYATWTFLFRRLGEGGAFPKVHRWIRSLFGITTVPQR